VLATKKANFEFYEARTLHKSSPSPATRAIMGNEVGDATQGNTHEGVHITSAGGTWQILVCGFGGFRVEQPDDVRSVAAARTGCDPLPAAA